MESILEKLTLYDLLGYTIPGSMIIISIKFIIFLNGQSAGQAVTYGYIEAGGMGLLIGIVLSYVLGIAISEVSGWLFELIVKPDKTYDWTEDRMKLTDNEVTAALKKAGLLSGSENINNRKELENYLERMYADISIDQTYKRIHNYASALVLYRNLFLAFLISAIMMLGLCVMDSVPICIFLIILSIIFLKRSIRFRNKKNKYTVWWFVHKYTLG